MPFIKKPIFYIPAIILFVLIITGIVLLFLPTKTEFQVLVIAPEQITQEVSVTGKVVAKNDVKLGFENSGRITAVYKDVGNSVKAGEAIAVLDNSEIYAKLLQAEAERDRAKAELDQLKRGTRPEELEIAKVKVGNAEVALADARKNLVDKLNDAFVKSDDAIRAKVDQFMTNPRTQNPKLNIQVDSQLAGKIESSRLILETTLNGWQTNLSNLTVASNLESHLTSASANLSIINSFLNDVSFGVNSLYPSTNITQATIDSYKTDILTARTNINGAVSNLTTAGEKLRTADSNLRLESNNLKLSLAGATAGDLEASEANLKSAEANVLNLQSQLAKTVIRAPFAGTISVQDAKVGEIVTSGQALVSLLGSKLHIETYVPEADIAKIHLKDLAKVTLDAYGNETEFLAEVVFIDPAETTVESVSTYRSLLEFKSEDPRIRSGMTANLDIITAVRENILAIPQRAIVGQNGDMLVKILVGKEVVEKKVRLGIRGIDGQVEILSGLEVGDRVIIN